MKSQIASQTLHIQRLHVYAAVRAIMKMLPQKVKALYFQRASEERRGQACRRTEADLTPLSWLSHSRHLLIWHMCGIIYCQHVSVCACFPRGAWQTSISCEIMSFWNRDVIKSACWVSTHRRLEKAAREPLKPSRSGQKGKNDLLNCWVQIRITSANYGLNKMYISYFLRDCYQSLSLLCMGIRSTFAVRCISALLNHGNVPLLSAVSIPMNNQQQLHSTGAAPHALSKPFSARKQRWKYWRQHLGFLTWSTTFVGLFFS